MRPGSLAEPGPQRSDRSLRHSSGDGRWERKWTPPPSPSLQPKLWKPRGGEAARLEFRSLLVLLPDSVTAETDLSCSSARRKRKKKRRKRLPRTSSFARAGPSCSVPASCQMCSARYLGRQRIHVHASVSEALGFTDFLHAGGPQLLGRFSSLSCVLASSEECKKMGFPFPVLCLVRLWIHAHESV